MKAIHIPERIMGILLILGACLGAWFIWYVTVHDYNELPDVEKKLIITKDEAVLQASTFLDTHFKQSARDFQIVSEVFGQETGINFLDEALSEDEVRVYQNKYGLVSAIYHVRFFKELELQEYSIYLDAYRGNVIEFSELTPEEMPRGTGTLDEGKALALDFGVQMLGIDNTNLELLDASEETLPGGKVFTYRYALLPTKVPSSFGEGYTELEIIVEDSRITSFVKSFFIPDSFTRELTRKTSMGEVFGVFSLLAWGGMFVIAFIVMLRQFVAGSAYWKLSLFAMLVLGVLSAVDIFNNYSLLKMSYETDVAYSTHAILFIAFGLLGAAFGAFTFFVPAVAGHSQAVATDVDRIFPLNHLPQKKSDLTPFVHALWKGYLIGILSLGMTYALFFFGEKYLGVWYLGGDAPAIDYSVNAYVPVFTDLIMYGLFAAITEELIFRLFGILYLRKILRSTILGVMAATLVWAFAHSDGSIYPTWFRGVEVLIGGLVWAYFFLRYNILTTIVAHYVHNTILSAISFVLILGTNQLIPSVIMLLFPWILLGFMYVWLLFGNQRASDTPDTVQA
jgi:hypothetical protein